MAEFTKTNKVSFFRISQTAYDNLVKNTNEGLEGGIIAGAIYFVEDGTVGRIYVDSKCYGEANLTKAVTEVSLETEGDNTGKIKVTYTSGDPTYIPLPEGRVYTAGNGISISDSNVVSAEMDYISDNVTLGTDIVVTNTTGALAAGKTVTADTSIKDLLKKILQEVKQPGTPTLPSVSVKLTNAGAKEVGTKVTPAYTTAFNAGSYTYGPATGVTASGYSVSDGTVTKDTSTGSFEEITVEDSTNYKLTATATYTEGVVAKDNTGAASNPEVKISAGTTAAATSASITGFRSYFYGTKTGDDVKDAYTSADVRALTNGNSAANAGKNFSMNIPAGTKQVVIAVPSARSLASVINVGLSRGEVADTFIQSQVDVEGANGYTAVPYNVYVFTSSTSLDANTYEVTLG